MNFGRLLVNETPSDSLHGGRFACGGYGGDICWYQIKISVSAYVVVLNGSAIPRIRKILRYDILISVSSWYRMCLNKYKLRSFLICLYGWERFKAMIEDATAFLACTDMLITCSKVHIYIICFLWQKYIEMDVLNCYRNGMIYISNINMNLLEHCNTSSDICWLRCRRCQDSSEIPSSVEGITL